MTEEEYVSLKNRLIEDFWAYVGHQAFAFLMFIIEWTFKAAGAAWPFILDWLKKQGLL